MGTLQVSCQYLVDTQPVYPASIFWIHSPYLTSSLTILWELCQYPASILQIHSTYLTSSLTYLMGTLQVPFRHSLLPVPYWYLAGTLLLSHCGDPKGSEACKLLTSLWFLNEENKQETATVYTLSLIHI